MLLFYLTEPCLIFTCTVMAVQMALWFILVLLRIGWSLVPQSGYIHPDEFFQTVEVVTGKLST